MRRQLSYLKRPGCRVVSGSWGDQKNKKSATRPPHRRCRSQPPPVTFRSACRARRCTKS